jgi:hypothetical protein
MKSYFEVFLIVGIATVFAGFYFLKDYGVNVPEASNDIVTVDPGVHCFPNEGFQEALAKWIIDHPDHEVVTICKSHEYGYFVVTRVKPEFLNYVLPGQANPNGGGE